MIEVRPHDPTAIGRDRSDAMFAITEAVGVESTPFSGPAFAPPWPDPATESVRLAPELQRQGSVTVRAFDLAGRLVATPIANERWPAGRTTRTWRPAALARGVYTLRARIGGVERIQRMVWLGSN